MEPSTYRYRGKHRSQAALIGRTKEIAATRVRYGCRRIHVLVRREGWAVNAKRIYRLYREPGLQLCNKVPKRRVKAELLVTIVVEALDGRVLDGSVHPLDLAVGPGMIDAGEVVLDAVLGAAQVEHVGQVAGGGPVGVARRQAELDAVVGEHGADAIGYSGDEGFKECGGCDAVGAFDQLDEGELAGAVDGNEEVELAFGGLHLGDVDVEVSDGIGLEGLLGGLVAFDLGQARDTVALQAAVQR